MNKCYTNGCSNTVVAGNLCENCAGLNEITGSVSVSGLYTREELAATLPMSQRYPKYYKAIPHGVTELDVYMVHQLFNIQDPSGAIQHASKKLLLSGSRTGGKTKHDDIREARDALNRWLEMNP